MSDIGNKRIFARNLTELMDKKGVDRYTLCADLDFKYSTLCEWISAKKYPRIDKIEKLANYFDVPKSILIEKNGLSSYSDIPSITLTSEEEKLVLAYRAHPEHQSTIKKILDIDSNTIELHLAASDGATATVKVNDAAELRKDTEALRRKNGLL